MFRKTTFNYSYSHAVKRTTGTKRRKKKLKDIKTEKINKGKNVKGKNLAKGMSVKRKVFSDDSENTVRN